MTATQPFTLPAGDWQGMTYPRRIPPLPRGQRRPYQRFFLWLIRRGSHENYDYNVFLVLARLGRIFPIHALLVSALLQKGQISRPDTERIVIRVAWHMGCQYEYAHHTAMALENGVSRDEIDTLTRESDDSWTDRTRTLLTSADELYATHNLSPATFERLSRHLDQDQIVEFCMLVGHYVMGGMIINVSGVEIEPPYALNAVTP